jgi:hypothetical protein
MDLLQPVSTYTIRSFIEHAAVQSLNEPHMRTIHDPPHKLTLSLARQVKHELVSGCEILCFTAHMTTR